MEMATAAGYKNTHTSIANPTNRQHILQYTQKINAGKYYEKIKISINNKIKKLKFLLNLYLNIILCISHIKLNNSMLKFNNYQRNCIIKWLENETIFNISVKFISKLIWNFLKKLKIRSELIIENVKIIKILHIVRHFVGICLIRLISLKRLQQIPVNHHEKQEKLLKWQIVGNAQYKNQTKSYKTNRNHKKHEQGTLLKYKNLRRRSYKIVGNSQFKQKSCYLKEECFENRQKDKETKKNENSKENQPNFNDKVKNQQHSSCKWVRNCQIVGNTQNCQNENYICCLTNHNVENKEKVQQTTKTEDQKVGNFQNYTTNINYLCYKDLHKMYQHLSHKRKSEDVAKNKEKYFQTIKTAGHKVGNSQNYKTNKNYLNYKELQKMYHHLSHKRKIQRQMVAKNKDKVLQNTKIESHEVGSSQNCTTNKNYLNYKDLHKMYQHLSHKRKNQSQQVAKNMENNLQTTKIIGYKVGNSQKYTTNINYSNYNEKELHKMYHHLSHKGKSQIFAKNKEKSFQTTKIASQKVGNSHNYKTITQYLSFREKKQTKMSHHLSQRRKNNFEIVGNSQNCALKENFKEMQLYKKGIEENEKRQVYSHHMIPMKRRVHQKVGNSQNEEKREHEVGSHIHAQQQEREMVNPNGSKLKHKVGNSQNCAYKDNGNGICSHLKEHETTQFGWKNIQEIEQINSIGIANSLKHQRVYQTIGSTQNKEIRMHKVGCYLNHQQQDEISNSNGYYLNQKVGSSQKCVSKDMNNDFYNIFKITDKTQFSLKYATKINKLECQKVGNSYSCQINFRKVANAQVERTRKQDIGSYLNERQQETGKSSLKQKVGNSLNYASQEMPYGFYNKVIGDGNTQFWLKYIKEIEKTNPIAVGNSKNFQITYQRADNAQNRYIDLSSFLNGQQQESEIVNPYRFSLKQKVGNSLNSICKDVESDFNGNLEQELKTQLYLEHVREFSKMECKKVGNTQYCKNICQKVEYANNNETGKRKIRSRSNIQQQQAEISNSRHRQTVGKSRNCAAIDIGSDFYKNVDEEEKAHFYLNPLSYIHKMKYKKVGNSEIFQRIGQTDNNVQNKESRILEIARYFNFKPDGKMANCQSHNLKKQVGNAPNCLYKEIGRKFYKEEEKVRIPNYLKQFSHINEMSKRRVGNTKSYYAAKEHQETENSKGRFKYYNHLLQNMINFYIIVGNSQICHFLNDNDILVFKQVKAEELRNVHADKISFNKKSENKIVGNSSNYKYESGNYAENEKENAEHIEASFYHFCCLRQAILNFNLIIGNANIYYHSKFDCNLTDEEVKVEELQNVYTEKRSLKSKRENKIVGNAQNCKMFNDISGKIQNDKKNQEMLIYSNIENKTTERHPKSYKHIMNGKFEIVGNAQNCKRRQNEKENQEMLLCFNIENRITEGHQNTYNHQVNRNFQIIGNTRNSSYFTNYLTNIYEHEENLTDLVKNYHQLTQITENPFKIVGNSENHLKDTQIHPICHTKKANHNFNHRQNLYIKQQVKCVVKCHNFIVLLMFYCYHCWHALCGIPLKSREIFEYLENLIVRKLTWLKTLTSVADNDASSSSPSSLCGRKLTKPTRKVKVDIIANQHECIKKSQTFNQQKRKSTFTSTTSSSSSLQHSITSSLSFTSSSSLSATSSRMTLATTTPYCHYQQQQPHHHHLRHSPATTTTSTTTTITTTPYTKLPSLLLLSRTLIILILLSSLWHTSEGFHGTGVKLSPNTVKTKYGLVRGIVVRSSPSLVEAYLGIPYASPPVGSLRFMPPITPSTWKNVRNADRFSPVCPQTVPIPPNGPEALLEVPRARLAQLRRLLPLLSNQSEDCLYLNIYVPYENRRHRRFTTNSGEANDSPKLPTILFIHGESYEWNSGNPYDGSELAAHGNVIVVTINFRLGIFGFLKTGGKESAQGNFGLMDLVAGLHWLKENLPAFGGDPQAITLLGHGTGAALANILVVSPVASDLVQHSVLVSGSALSPWAIQKNPLFVKRRVAEQTGCHGDMLYDDLAPCLRTKTVNELLAVKIDHPRFLVGFAPFIDGTVISPNTDSIGKLSLPLGSAIVSTSGIEYANFPKRNLIFCLTSVESHLDLSAQDLEFGFNETRRDRILRTYVRNNFHYHLNEIFAVLKNEYTDWDKAIRSPLSSRDATLQFLSDGHTASSLIKLGYMHSLRGGRGYFLHFKHRTIEEEYPQRTGSVRGEDVPFWLGLPISPLFPHNYTTQEKQISRLMLRYLANFAKTGNPNQSSLSSPLPSSSSLIAPSPSSSSSSSSPASVDHQQVKRSSSSNILNSTSFTRGPIVVDVATATAREAVNLAVLYNQRRTKRTYNKRHSRSNDDNSGSDSNEMSYFSNVNSKLDGDELPFWDAYDVVNQLYMELGNKAEIQSHYRGHKLSMWLNLIPQLHRHANMNDQSMRHHQFQDDLNNMNLYEGIVRAQTQVKPPDDEDTLLLPKGRTTPPPVPQETNTTQKPSGGTTECGVDGAMFVAEMTTTSPSDNRSLVLDSREKEMATASTGLIGNLEVLRRLSGKQFQSYTTALVATVAVGCFLLILNILIFAGIYHQREKRARDAKTKEELQDNDTSKNSSMLKLNAMGSETGSFNGSGAGVSGKTTVVFGEYSCYDEKSLQTKDEKLIVELPPAQMLDSNWAACSTSTLDLLKTKHHVPLEATYPLSNVVPITTSEQQQQTEHLMAVNAMEMSTYNPLPMGTGLIIDPSIAAATSSGLLSKRGSFIGSSNQLNQYDFASVQSSDQMSFKDIENAVKVSVTRDDDITQDDDIPEPPPPPRSFQSMQHQQAQHNLQLAQQQQQQGPTTTSVGTSAGGASGGGILRQAGTSSATQTGGGKKRVHIQEISV